MDSKIVKNSYVKNIVLMLALILIVIFIIAKNNNMYEMYNTIKGADIRYLILAIICAIMFQICEAFNINQILSTLGVKRSNIDTLRYSAVGFFFSSITPSSSGGQPMQVYYMKKDNIDISLSTLTLLIEFASFQLVTVIFAAVTILTRLNFIKNQSITIKIMLAYGMIVTIVIIILVTLALIYNKVLLKVANWVFNVIEKLRIKKIRETTKQKVIDGILEYNKATKFIREKPYIFVKVTFVAMVQVLITYSIPFFVYKALGFNEYSYFNIVTIQALLSIAVSSIPVPGAVGVSESAFILLFSNIYSQEVLDSAMILTRGINFYFILLITPLIIYGTEVIEKSKMKFKKAK